MSTSLKTIARTLQETADLGICCTSSHINQWSFYKPINSESISSLTDEDYYSVNDGFTLFTFNTPQRMLYELTHPNVSNIWKYTEREAPYRLTDFENYHHSGDNYYSLYFETDNSGTIGTTLRLYCGGISEMIDNWAYYDDDRNQIDLCFLIYEDNKTYSESGNEGVYVYKIMKYSLYDQNESGGFNFTIPSSLTANKNYIIRLCCTTATENLNNGDCVYYVQGGTPVLSGLWYAMPHNTQATLHVQSGSGGGGSSSTDFFNYLQFDFDRGSWEFNNMVLSNISFRNLVTISSSTNKTFNIGITYYYENAATRVQLGYAYRTLNEDDVPWANIEINYRDNIYVISEADLNNKITITAEVTVTSSGVTQTKTIITTILRD